eukprot:11207565-Lingulodinium_polyedra.AAC.1
MKGVTGGAIRRRCGSPSLGDGKHGMQGTPSADRPPPPGKGAERPATVAAATLGPGSAAKDASTRPPEP